MSRSLPVILRFAQDDRNGSGKPAQRVVGLIVRARPFGTTPSRGRLRMAAQDSICARCCDFVLTFQKSTGFGLSCLVAYNSGSLGSPFSHTSSIERFGENP
jgi:hypothetical protein